MHPHTPRYKGNLFVSKPVPPTVYLDLRGLVPLGLLLDQLPLGVDREDPAQRHPHLFVGKCILCGDT